MKQTTAFNQAADALKGIPHLLIVNGGESACLNSMFGDTKTYRTMLQSLFNADPAFARLCRDAIRNWEAAEMMKDPDPVRAAFGGNFGDVSGETLKQMFEKFGARVVDVPPLAKTE